MPSKIKQNCVHKKRGTQRSRCSDLVSHCNRKRHVPQMRTYVRVRRFLGERISILRRDMGDVAEKTQKKFDFARSEIEFLLCFFGHIFQSSRSCSLLHSQSPPKFQAAALTTSTLLCTSGQCSPSSTLVPHRTNDRGCSVQSSASLGPHRTNDRGVSQTLRRYAGSRRRRVRLGCGQIFQSKGLVSIDRSERLLY